MKNTYQIHAKNKSEDWENAHWEIEPECMDLTLAEAKKIIKGLEKENEEGTALEYRIVDTEPWVDAVNVTIAETLFAENDGIAVGEVAPNLSIRDNQDIEREESSWIFGDESAILIDSSGRCELISSEQFNAIEDRLCDNYNAEEAQRDDEEREYANGVD